ncbi:MAG TPA: amylo-alpha-1,6-glucosidase [Verrucomicrobiae bacterium]|jgi:predicted glycogen debranching enzyme
MDKLVMSPVPGERLLRFVGDRVRFSLRLPAGAPAGARALLRTNLGKAARLRQEIIATHAGKNPMSVAFWRDVPLLPESSGEWAIELPLTDAGFYRAKAYMADAEGRQYWPEGEDAGISVHPNSCRTGNTIYCAFTRMFGPTRAARQTDDPQREKELNKFDDRGYAVIPPSGTLRDLARELPHIIDTLGCRVLHLLPVGPAPTTFARFGRFGSPYACQDLTAIDPALVEFDKKTNGAGQFCELTREAHRRGARVLLDMVINHTGWGSTLFENHPAWFAHDADGTFVSPGAWGVTWGDLVELNLTSVELWDVLAEVFLTWCRRGVDGFRCDAGYKVPTPVWQYIEARVRQEFPDAIFLLEGLGGPWEATEALLTEGGMQWAYSELFQNYGGADVARYLDYSLRQSQRVGLYVHYSETHDNPRLAAKGREWSLLRNRLCALASVSGGFGFTCGVEWLAPERINVHSSRGLCWGAKENIIPELARLNQLLANHPCFFDGAKVMALSGRDSAVCALRRDSAEGLDSVLVLVNTDERQSRGISIASTEYELMKRPALDLLGQRMPRVETGRREMLFTLEPGAAFCLAVAAEPAGMPGGAYRRARAQSAWAISALSKTLLPEQIGPCPWGALASRVHLDARGFLGCLAHLDPARSRTDLAAALDAAQGQFPQVVEWTTLDRRRITPIPPGHWLLLRDIRPFRARLKCGSADALEVAESIEVRDGFAACFAPKQPEVPLDAELELERYAATTEVSRAQVRFLRAAPSFSANMARPPAGSLILLTNGRGGMARLGVDLGYVKSKYDCVLGANLHPDYPVDRHVLAKRLRAWISADGFVTPLNLQNLASFEIGQPAAWNFMAEAGDSRTVELRMTADMLAGSNTTVFAFARQPGTLPADLPPRFEVRIIVRVDIEDRNFHWETVRNGGADAHFSQHCHALNDCIGFAFTPAADRQLRVVSSAGRFHSEPEWCQGIPHPVEQSRGQTGSGDAYSPGWFEFPLEKNGRVTLALSAEAPPPDFAALNPAPPAAREQDSFGQQLGLAARAFVARRESGRTIIAGYPWFLDWGRDTFISARGLLAAGMVTEVEEMLETFGRFEENGTMPNIIHGSNASNRDTSDAPLWYGVLCEETAACIGGTLYEKAVNSSGKTIADVLGEIAAGYARGTPNGIRMDPASGLIWSPRHFTWMDTNYPAGTPREGYPVEIQALWIRLLRQLQRLEAKAPVEPWAALAERAGQSLRKYFWLEEQGYISDLLIAPPGGTAAAATRDQALRVNFLFAAAFGLFKGAQARRAVEAAFRHLFVPGAMRTLAPLPAWPPLVITASDGRALNNPREPYWGRYQGDEDTQRKPAYHNGTAWPWVLPTACEAMAKAWDSAPAAVAAAKACLGSLESLLTADCLGQIPEILDGDAPHQARGCDAQAWSVLEALRVWKELQKLGTPPPAR